MEPDDEQSRQMESLVLLQDKLLQSSIGLHPGRSEGGNEGEGRREGGGSEESEGTVANGNKIVSKPTSWDKLYQ